MRPIEVQQFYMDGVHDIERLPRVGYSVQVVEPPL